MVEARGLELTQLRNVSIVLNRRRITCNFLDLGLRFQSLLRSFYVCDYTATRSPVGKHCGVTEDSSPKVRFIQYFPEADFWPIWFACGSTSVQCSVAVAAHLPLSVIMLARRRSVGPIRHRD